MSGELFIEMHRVGLVLLFSLLFLRLLNLTSLFLLLFVDNGRVLFEGVIGHGEIVEGAVSTMSCNHILSFISFISQLLEEHGFGCFHGVRLLEEEEEPDCSCGCDCERSYRG